MRRIIHTLRGRFIVLFLMTVLPVLLMILAANAYMTRLTRSQLLSANEAVLASYTAQLSSTLDAMRAGLVNAAVMDATFDSMQYLPEGNERLSARVAIYNRLKNCILQYPLLHMAFAYSSYSEDFLTYEQEDLSFAQKQEIRASVRAWLDDPAGAGTSSWALQMWDGTAYLVYLYHWGDTYIGGVVQAADTLEIPLPTAQGWFAGLFCQEELVAQTPGLDALALAEPLGCSSGYLESGSGECLAVAAGIQGAPYTILAVSRTADLLQKMPAYQGALLGAGIFCALLFPTMFSLLSSTLVRPVQELVRVMNAVSDGNLQARVDPGRMAGLEEFILIGGTFNRSVEQVQSLTRQIYQKELERQKAQLHTLQMQVSPHFLMNSLNIIYTASLAQKNASVQEMCTYLSRYFRYSMQIERERVRLEEEAKFTEDYLHIQELRFENRFEYSIQVPPFLKDALVPCMALKTFVENSVKYAVGAQSYVQLTIQAQLENVEQGGLLHLVIEDTGPGYPAQMLQYQGGTPPYNTTEHTGLWNMMERMHLLYGDAARITLGQRPGGGAKTELVLPLQKEKEGEENVPGVVD